MEAVVLVVRLARFSGAFCGSYELALGGRIFHKTIPRIRHVVVAFKNGLSRGVLFEFWKHYGKTFVSE